MIIDVDITTPKRVEKNGVMNFGFITIRNIVVNF